VTTPTRDVRAALRVTRRPAFVFAAALALVIAACTSPDPSIEPSVMTDASGSGAASRLPSASAAPSASGSATAISAFDLEVGDCFEAPDVEAVTDVELIDCEEPHRYESYHIENHPAGRDEPFIGDDAMKTYADDICIGAFEEFVGIPWEESSLTYFFLQPTADTWEEIGDREVLCAVYSTDGDLTGSVAGSER
jgi:hypothetical protein